jgi:hypothetical protein
MISINRSTTVETSYHVFATFSMGMPMEAMVEY